MKLLFIKNKKFMIMFKPKIKRKNKFIKFVTSQKIVGITLAPFGIYLRDDIFDRMPQKTIIHETIHWKQQTEMLIFFFYLWYIIEWIIRIFTNRLNAYRNISFEREAYDNDNNLKYLDNRKHYSWIKRIFK